MHIRPTFLLSTLLLTDAVILVFLTGMIQQHVFSLKEEDPENNSNNPPGFKYIKKFDSNGNFITSWGTEGDGDGQFLHAHDIAIDSSDNVYVVDSGNVHEKKDICVI